MQSSTSCPPRAGCIQAGGWDRLWEPPVAPKPHGPAFAPSPSSPAERVADRMRQGIWWPKLSCLQKELRNSISSSIQRDSAAFSQSSHWCFIPRLHSSCPAGCHCPVCSRGPNTTACCVFLLPTAALQPGLDGAASLKRRETAFPSWRASPASCKWVKWPLALPKLAEGM